MQIEGKPDLLLSSVFFSDSNNDGFNEMTFIVKAGFSLYPRRFFKYDFSGKLLQKELMDQEQLLTMLNNGVFELDKLGFSDGRNLYIYNDDLKLIDVKKSVGFPVLSGLEFGFTSITNYFIFYNLGEVLLFNSKLEEMGRVKVPGNQIQSRLLPSLVSMESNRSFVMALSNSEYGEYLIHVEKRSFAYVKILISILIYIGFYLFFYLVFRLQYFFYTSRLISEQKIQSLQLQTVQNQLQPHFTFNVLNTIGSLIYKNEKETAYEYLNYFSDMLRSVLVSRKGSDWMIDEEIRFIETYVAMENLRFDSRFIFSLTVSPDTDISARVPRLMVQTFVENAISHGLMHKKDDCRLSVNIEEDDTYVVVTVEDNGIGRFASGKLQRNNAGHGNDIMENYIEVYNKINKTKFNFTVTDLFTDEGKAGGTKVVLWIPRDYSGNTRSL